MDERVNYVLNCPIIKYYVHYVNHYVSFDVHVTKLKEIWSMKVGKMRIQVGGGNGCVGGGSNEGGIG